MRTLQLELEDGRTLEVEVDDAQPTQKEVAPQEKSNAEKSRERYPLNIETATAPLKTLFRPDMESGGPLSPLRFFQGAMQASEGGRNAIMRGTGLGEAIERVPQHQLTPRIPVPREAFGLAGRMLPKDMAIPSIGTRDVARFGAEEFTNPINYIGGFGATKRGASMLAKPTEGVMAGLEAASKASGKVTGLAKEIYGSGKALSRAEVGSERITQKIESLRDKIPQAKQALVDSAVDDAVLYKNKLRPISKENSKIYRAGLDEAEASANITRSKVQEIAQSAIDEAIEQGIDVNSPVLAKLKEIGSKYGPQTEEVFDWNKLQDVKRVIDDKLSVKELRNIKNEIFRIADKSQDGADEVANAIFMKKYGQELAGQSKTFQLMQDEYAPYVEAKKWAYRTFKPFTKDEIPNGNAVIRRISAGTAKPEDYAYLERLEQGSGRFKGTGEMRSSSQSMANTLKNISDEIKMLRRAKVKNSKDIQKLRRLVGIRDKIAIGALTTLGTLGAGAAAVYKLSK